MEDLQHNENTEEVVDDEEVEDENPEDVVTQPEGDIPSENVDPSSAPNNEAPDGV